MKDRNDDNQVLAELRTRGIFGNPGGTILTAACFGMALMFVPITLDLSPFLGMAALLGGICLVLGLRAGRMDYRLTPEGLERHFRPFLQPLLKLPARRQSFSYADIKAYRRGEDLARSLRERAFLNIDLRRAPHRIAITGEHDEAGFQAFADAFERQVARLNRGEAAPPLEKPGRRQERPRPIRAKGSFYDTLGAKALTLFFLLLSAGLGAAYLSAEGTPGNLIRFALVILPGTAYLTWRVFIKKGKAG